MEKDAPSDAGTRADQSRPAGEESAPDGQLDALLATLAAASFDAERQDGPGSLRATCAFHRRDEAYVLHRKATLWAAETHEYMQVHCLPRLDMAAGLSRVLGTGFYLRGFYWQPLDACSLERGSELRGFARQAGEDELRRVPPLNEYSVLEVKCPFVEFLAVFTVCPVDTVRTGVDITVFIENIDAVSVYYIVYV